MSISRTLGRSLAVSYAVAAMCVSSAIADPVGHDCVLWIKADEGVTTDVNGRVTLATDHSGAGHHATIGSGVGPLLVPNALNGRAVMRFDGNDWMSVAGQVLTNQQFTIIAVVNDTRTNSGFREIISNWTSSTGGTSVFLGTTALNPEGPNTTRVRFTDDVGGANQGQAGVGVITDRHVHFILTGISRTTNAEVYQNRVLIAGRATPIGPRNFATAYVLGRQGTTSEFWLGDVAEILVYNAELTRCELDAVYDSLNDRYGLAPCDPVISDQPDSIGICPGGSPVLSVQAAGGLCDSNFTYQWSKDGAPLTDGGAFSGALTSQLTVSNLSSNEEGEYRCAITNTCGTTTSDAATLSVCIGDSDCDQDADSDDITTFFAAWEVGDGGGDADLDGDTDSDDIIVFFASWEAGC